MTNGQGSNEQKLNFATRNLHNLMVSEGVLWESRRRRRFIKPTERRKLRRERLAARREMAGARKPLREHDRRSEERD